MALAHLLRPVGADDQQPRAAVETQQVVQPLQVSRSHHCRSSIASRSGRPVASDCARQGLERRWRCQASGQRQRPGQVRAARPAPPAAAAPPRRARRRPARQRTGAQPGGDRGVGQLALGRIAARCGARRFPAGRPLQQLLGQSGLADAGLAAQHNTWGAPSAGTVRQAHSSCAHSASRPTSGREAVAGAGGRRPASPRPATARRPRGWQRWVLRPARGAGPWRRYGRRAARRRGRRSGRAGASGAGRRLRAADRGAAVAGRSDGRCGSRAAPPAAQPGRSSALRYACRSAHVRG